MDNGTAKKIELPEDAPLWMVQLTGQVQTGMSTWKVRHIRSEVEGVLEILDAPPDTINDFIKAPDTPPWAYEALVEYTVHEWESPRRGQKAALEWIEELLTEALENDVGD